MTEHFTFFESYYKSVKDLPSDIKAEFYDTLFEYALYSIEPKESCNPVVKALFLMAMPNIDKSKARREAGKQGGSKRKQTQANVSKVEANASKRKQTLSDKDKDKDKDIDIDIDIDKELLLIPEWVNVESWHEWVSFRKQLKKTLTKITIKKQIKFLEEHKYNHVEIINQSIKNGWTGLFELKQQTKQNNIYVPVNGIRASDIRDAMAEEAERGLQNSVSE